MAIRFVWLGSAICQKIKEEDRESIESFLDNVLFEGLRDSHGCLIAVTDMSKAPSNRLVPE